MCHRIGARHDRQYSRHRHHLIARLVHAYASLPPEPEPDAEATRTRISDAINAEAGRGEPHLLAWLARFLPRDPDVRAAFGDVFTHIECSEDRLVRIVYLAYHVHAPEAPLLFDALEDDDPTIRRFAEALRHSIINRNRDRPTRQHESIGRSLSGDSHTRALFMPPSAPCRKRPDQQLDGSESSRAARGHG